MSTARVTRHTFPTLRAWRKALRINQREAALLLGLSQSHYSKLERRTHATTGRRAKAITAKTGVPIDALVGAA